MTTPTLAELRQAIDALDDQMHDLLMRRAELTAGVQTAKADRTGLFLRPAREAQILRRLAARHKGPLPRTALSAIWRQLIGGLYPLQGGLTVGVSGGPDLLPTYDLARLWAGALADIVVHEEPIALLQWLGRTPAGVAVVPLPRDGALEPWWRHLVGEAAGTPRIIARLPQVARAGERTAAYVLAGVPPEESGADISLVVATLRAGEVSRARHVDLVREAGFDAQALAGATIGPESLLLVEVERFVARDDARLARFARLTDDLQGSAMVIGAHAVPLKETE